MAETKYGKYLITDCTRERPESFGVPGNMVTMRRIKEAFEKSNINGGGGYYTKPFVMIKEKHVHKYDDYLFFLGTDFDDMNSFDAEIELYMGEEGEKHVITKPTIAFIPAGVYHCPLNFVKLNKPVFFLHIMDHSVE